MWRRRAQESPRRSSFVSTGRQTLKRVYKPVQRQSVRADVRQGVDLQTPGPSTETEGQTKACVPVLSCLSC